MPKHPPLLERLAPSILAPTPKQEPPEEEEPNPLDRVSKFGFLSGGTSRVAQRKLAKAFDERIFDAPLRVRRTELPENFFARIRNSIGEAAEGTSAGTVAEARVLGFIPVLRDLLPVRIGQVLGLPLDAAAAFTDTYLKGIGADEVTTEEIEGVTVRGGRARDVTDPSVDLSKLREAGVDVFLSEPEQRIRNLRRMFVAAGQGLQQGGIEEAYERGFLAPPDNETEALMDFGGRMLADIGVTLPLIPIALPAAAAGATAAVARGPGKAALTSLGRWAAKVFGPGADDVVKRGVQRGLTMFGLDAEIGAAIGTRELFQAMERGEEIGLDDVASRVVGYALLGGAIGGVFGLGRGGIGLTKLALMKDAIRTGPFPAGGGSFGFGKVGTRVGDLEIVGRGPGGGAQWKRVNPETGKPGGKFVKAPTADDARAAATNFVGRAKASAQQTEAVLAEATDLPMPPGLEGGSTNVQTLAVLHSRGIRMRLGRSMTEESLRREMGELRALAFDITQPSAVRLSYLGKARAIEEVLGEPAPRGMVPFAVEREAVRVVERMSPSLAARHAAGVEATDPVLNQRIFALLAEGFPERYNNVLAKELLSKRLGPNRGVGAPTKTSYTEVVLPDGRRMAVIGQPAYGVAAAREIKSGTQALGPLEPITLENAVLIPRAGSTARLTDGTVVDVVGVDPLGGNVKVRGPGRPEGDVTLEQIAEVGHSGQMRKIHRHELERAQDPSKEGAQPIPPSIVTTPEGEVGIAVAQGERGTVVRLKDGRERVVTEVQPTTETAAVERQVVTFVPGERPPPAKHTLFAVVPEDQVAAFEAAYAAREPLDQFLQGGVHVLPPTVAGRGIALYAVELPQSALPKGVYLDDAVHARKAINGKPVRLETYESLVEVNPQSVAQGRFMRVPETLHAKVQRPKAELAKMRGKARTEYLRGLLDFNENVSSPIDAATQRATVAKRRKSAAVRANDGGEVTAAATEIAEAHHEVARTMVTEAIERTERAVVNPIMRRVVATDPQENAFLNRALSGDKEALAAVMETQIAEGEGVLLIHKTVSGRVFLLQREVSPQGEVGRLTAMVEEGGRQLTTPLKVEPTVAEARSVARALGFADGFHRRSAGEFVLDGDAYIRASVDPNGRIRIFRGERLSGTRQVVWRLDATGKGVDVKELGFIPERRIASERRLGATEILPTRLIDPETRLPRGRGRRGGRRRGEDVVPPPWEVGPLATLGADAQPLFGGDIGRVFAPRTDDLLERGAEIYAQRMETATWAPSVRQLLTDDPTGADPFLASYAEFQPTGQTVKVLDPDLASSRLLVEFPDGTTREIAKREAVRLRAQDPLVTDYRIAQAAARGELDGVARIPPAGYGTLERELNLLGARPAVVQEAALKKAQELTQTWGLQGGVVLNADPQSALSFFRLYDRALDLGFAQEVLSILPEKLHQPVRYAAYQHLRETLGDTPHAQLLAAAKFDGLPKATLTQLREMATEHGLSPDLSPARLVENLWERGAIDPEVARWTTTLRDDAGFVRYLEATALPDGMVTVRPPIRRAQSFLSRWVNGTNFEMRNHPTSSALESMVYDAYEGVERAVQGRVRFIGSLQQRGMKDRHVVPVGKLLRQYDTWQEAIAAKDPLATPEVRPWFEEFRRAFDEDLRAERRSHLERGTEPVHTDKLPADERNALLIKIGLNPDIVSPDFVVMPRFYDESFGSFRPSKIRRSPQEIQRFEDLIDSYASSVDLPEGLPKWMTEDFDFWKRWRRSRYFPGGMDGEFLLQVEVAANEWRSLAWSETMEDALDLFRGMQREGQHTGSRPRIVSRQAVADPDVVQRLLGPAEFAKMARTLKEAVVLDSEEIGALFAPSAYTPPKGTGKPLRGGMLARTADLDPTNFDVVRAYLMKGQQLARTQYRYKVADAARTTFDREFDGALSARAGVAPLHQQEQLMQYTRNYISSALGEPTPTDRWVGSVLAWSDTLYNAPRVYGKEKLAQFNRWLKGEEGATMPFAEVFDPTFYRQQGRAQRWASDVGMFQTILRLGLSPAYLMINRFQHAINGVPAIFERFGTKGMDAARGAWVTAERLGWHQFNGKIPKSLKWAQDLVEEIGEDITTGKYSAGVSAVESGLWGGAARPITLGLRWPDKVREWFRFVVMHPGQAGESTVRQATGIGAYQAGRASGLSHEGAIQAARSAVEKAHFRYDALAIPQLMRHGPIGGAVARVVLKFKPFMINQVGFEMRAAKASMDGLKKGDATPLRAWGNHLAAYMVLGGLRGVLNHPFLSVLFALPFGLGEFIKAHGPWWLQPDKVQVKVREKQRELTREADTEEQKFRASVANKGYDMLVNGLPGLAGFAQGHRLGVSGQDLANLSESTAWLGPHLTVYQDWFNYARQQWGQRGAGVAIPGMAIGALATGLLPRGLRDAPWIRLVGATIGGAVATQETERPMYRALVTSPEGRRLLSRVAPTLARNVLRTMDIYSRGVLLDSKLRPTALGGESRSHELIAALLGTTTSQSALDQAQLSTLFPGSAALELTKTAMAREAARAYIDNERELLWRIIGDGLKLGIDLSWPTIQRQVRLQNRERMETMMRSFPVPVRVEPKVAR